MASHNLPRDASHSVPSSWIKPGNDVVTTVFSLLLQMPDIYEAGPFTVHEIVCRSDVVNGVRWCVYKTASFPQYYVLVEIDQHGNEKFFTNALSEVKPLPL